MVTLTPCHILQSQRRVDTLCRTHGATHPKCTMAVKSYTKLYIRFIKGVSSEPKHAQPKDDHSNKDGG